MDLIKKVFVFQLVLVVPYFILAYFGGMNELQPQNLMKIFQSGNETTFKNWFLRKSSMTDNSSLTNQNPAFKFNLSTNQKNASNTTSPKVNTTNKITTKAFSSQKPKSQTKYLIFQCSRNFCGGLGDRQAGVISTILLANLTNRKFGLIINKPCDVRQYLYPNKIQWDIPKSKYKQLSTKTVKFLKRETMRTAEHIDFNKEHKSDVVFLQTNYVLFYLLQKNPNYKKQLAWLSNTSYSEYFRENYRKIFKPSPIIANKLERILNKTKYANHSKLVCAQIRLGRNRAMRYDIVRNSKSSIKVIWDFLRQYNDSNRYKIFITTDSEEVRTEAKKRFSDQIIDSEGKVIHIDFHFTPNAAVCKGVEKVFLDQYILTNCDVLIHSRSGFGENAVRLKKDLKEIYSFRNGIISPSKQTNLDAIFPWMLQNKTKD